LSLVLWYLLFVTGEGQVSRDKIFWAPSYLFSLSGLFRCASRSVLVLFFLANNFSFLYHSHHTIFESETLQFTETFEIECGKNTLIFVWHQIYTSCCSCNIPMVCKVLNPCTIYFKGYKKRNWKKLRGYRWDPAHFILSHKYQLIEHLRFSDGD
jgi:hypothetical protein